MIKERLLRAAKARIERMIQTKTKRKDLQVPPFVREEWQNGNKTAMAQMLQTANFDKVACPKVNHASQAADAPKASYENA